MGSPRTDQPTDRPLNLLAGLMPSIGPLVEAEYACGRPKNLNLHYRFTAESTVQFQVSGSHRGRFDASSPYS